MEDRLRFHGNERVKRVQEIRRRNRRKRRIWLGLIITILIVLTVSLLDRNGLFEMFFSKSVSYDGNTEYTEMVSADGTASREDLVALSQILINHPFALGQEELTMGRPDGPIGSGAFVDWVFYNLTGKALSEKSSETGPLSTRLWDQSTSVMESELQVGDIGFSMVPEGSKVNHVGIYIGEIGEEKAFIHAGGVQYKAEGLEEGRVVVSLNNTLKRNNLDMYGNKFSPSAPSTQFVYYRRPNIEFVK
ncbi:NlpC/P60 family protein [Proteiniclasticum sp. C24MP]|uniref:NlpC/P60 family protein n=1 Tax=Proteiniclasticum sp. C24MP TaxID=3374101 RepID=UPI003754DBBB